MGDLKLLPSIFFIRSTPQFSAHSQRHTERYNHRTIARLALQYQARKGLTIYAKKKATLLTWPFLLVLDILEPDPQVDESGNQLLPSVTLLRGLKDLLLADLDRRPLR